MSYKNELPTLLNYLQDAMNGTLNLACRWYVLRGSNNDAAESAELLASQGVPAFTPLEYRSSQIGDEKVWELAPCQPDLLFVYATYDAVRIEMNNKSLASFHFVYDDDGLSPINPPNDVVDNLIRIVMASIPQSYSVTDEEIHYRPGGMVEVIDGPFKGIIGRVARVHTQTRVVASVPGVIAYATTYVPKHQTKKY